MAARSARDGWSLGKILVCRSGALDFVRTVSRAKNRCAEKSARSAHALSLNFRTTLRNAITLVLSSRAKTPVRLGPRDPDALPLSFHGGIPRLRCATLRMTSWQNCRAGVPPGVLEIGIGKRWLYSIAVSSEHSAV